MNRSSGFRYSLSKMFVAVTIIALFLAYAHWRRSSIVRETNDLQATGIRLLWTDPPDDTVWPVIPKEAEFQFNEISPNEIRIGAATYTQDEAKALHDVLMERLYRLGVEDVVLVKNGKLLNFSVSTSNHASAEPVRH